MFYWVLAWAGIATLLAWKWGRDPVWQIDRGRLSELEYDDLLLRDELKNSCRIIDELSDYRRQYELLRKDHDRLVAAYQDSKTIERRIRAIVNGQPPELGAK